MKVFSLRKLLNVEAVSQNELARRMGVHPSSLSNMVKEGADVKTSTIYKLASLLGVSPEDFFFEEDESEELKKTS